MTGLTNFNSYYFTDPLRCLRCTVHPSSCPAPIFVSILRDLGCFSSVRTPRNLFATGHMMFFALDGTPVFDAPSCTDRLLTYAW